MFNVEQEKWSPKNNAPKVLAEIDYFNVILIKDSKVLVNNLWKNKSDADNNFVNLGVEYSDVPMNKVSISKFIERGTFYFSGGFVVISKPNIK